MRKEYDMKRGCDLTDVTKQMKSPYEKLERHFITRLKELQKLWRAFEIEEGEIPELGSLENYGCLHYVSAGKPLVFIEEQITYLKEQREPYFRYYSVKGAGLADEFRFYCDLDLNPYRIEYRLSKIGLKKITEEKHLRVLLEIWRFLKRTEIPKLLGVFRPS